MNILNFFSKNKSAASMSPAPEFEQKTAQQLLSLAEEALANKDLEQAAACYEQAAQRGDPDVMLKVARAFDKRESDENPLYNPEKAKYWYTEVLYCGNSNYCFPAAKGLDAMIVSGKELRPPLDMEKAYQAYRQAARLGDMFAAELVGDCIAEGLGTEKDLRLAVTFYKRCATPEKALYCQKLANGVRYKDLWQQRCNLSAPALSPRPLGQRRELYQCEPSHNRSAFDGFLYYLTWTEGTGYLVRLDSRDWESPFRILARTDSYFYVHVNATGIYLYSYGSELPGGVSVCHLDFEGHKIAEFSKVFPGNDEFATDDVVFFGRNMYFVHSHTDPSTGRNASDIYRLDVDNQELTCLYAKASSVKSLCAGETELVFQATYENFHCEAYDDTGLMMLNLESGTTECLDKPWCSPENIVDHPELYDSENSLFVENWRTRLTIPFVDLERGIFWLKVTDWENGLRSDPTQIYWEPHPLHGDREKLAEGFPLWKMDLACFSEKFSNVNQQYFDGIYWFGSTSNTTFVSTAPDGSAFTWHSGGYGSSNRFCVLDHWLFVDLDAYGEKMYSLGNNTSADMAESLVAEYESPFAAHLPDKLLDTLKKGAALPLDFQYYHQDEEDLDLNFSDWLSDEESQETPDDSAANPFAWKKEESASLFTEQGERSDSFNWKPQEPLMSETEEPEDSRPAASSYDDAWDAAVPPKETPATPSPAFAGDAEPEGTPTLETIKTLGPTDIKYNICTFGVKFNLGCGRRLRFSINGKEYLCKTHNSVKGRVDGMKKLFSENALQQGDTLQARYYADSDMVFLKKISSGD